MPIVDSKIVSFIRKHHVLTLATSVGDAPWCANMFYAYMPEQNLFVFTSDYHTKHVKDAIENPIVAASIVLETKMVGRLQGLQLCGVMRPLAEQETAPRKAYLKRFPYAAAANLNLWIVVPTLFKFTDNTLGFGKKLLWNRSEEAKTTEG